MTTCARPGCGGVIDEYDLCDTCFRAPEPVVTAESAGERCSWPGCPAGVIDEDGLCDVCFRAPPKPKDAVTAARSPLWWLPSPWNSARGGAEGGPAPVTPVGASQALARAKLGLDVIEIPTVPHGRPADRVLRDPSVAESDRRCPNHHCRTEVGRGVDGRPGPLEGDCPVCGTEFSFRPALGPGDDLSPQYRIDGCIGYGGQGWVYLAHDRNLDDEPVAVKGLRGRRDEHNANMLATEKRTLIEVRHPDIVDIRNFVTRPRNAAGDGDDVYIVLEFLAGVSLAEKRERAGGVLPVSEAIAYIVATLPALGYLHDSGLLYGDFKPPNIMQVDDRVKLLDMGAVTRVGAPRGGRSWVTRGYTAPEVGTSGPSIASDLYSVGRTLAALTVDFDMGGRYESSLPEPGDVDVFATHESFYRFLRRATATDPRRRFSSAAQLAQQLRGVLCEVVAQEPGHNPARPGSTPSTLFTTERGVANSNVRTPLEPKAAALALPLPRFDDGDPAAGFLATLGTTEWQDVAKRLAAAPTVTPEVLFRQVIAHVELDEFGEALRALGSVDPNDWRRVWYGGLLDLARGAVSEAWQAFATLRDALPGELAPKLALAACAESGNAFDLARHYYRTVWRTDDSYMGAAFGLARAYLLGPTQDAGEHPVTVLEGIPERDHHHVPAYLEALRLRLERPDLNVAGVYEAAHRLRNLRLDEDDQAHLELRLRLFETARPLLAPLDAMKLRTPLLGVAPRDGTGRWDDAIGWEIERIYLMLRRYAQSWRDRSALVSSGHAARPWTTW